MEERSREGSGATGFLKRQFNPHNMNELKFTPGPWFVHDNVQDPIEPKQSNAKFIGTYDIKNSDASCGDDVLWIADAKPYECDGFADKATAFANAKLIAAAPDMFEVIKELYEYSMQSGHKGLLFPKIEAAYLKVTQ